METFKSIIIDRRNHLKMSKQELATKLKLPVQTIIDWEQGKSYPDISLLRDITEILLIDVNIILDAVDIQARVDNSNYKKRVIDKYRLSCLFSFLITTSGFMLSLFGSLLKNNYESIICDIMIILGFIKILFSIFWFVRSSIVFRGKYHNVIDPKDFDVVYFKYFISYLHVFLVISLFVIISLNHLNLVSYIIMLIVYLISGLITSIISIATNFKPKKDVVNLSMAIMSIVIYIYSIVLIIFFPSLYHQGKIVTLLMSYIIYLIYILRHQYIRKIK